jgi:hypothetical protein
MRHSVQIVVCIVACGGIAFLIFSEHRSRIELDALRAAVERSEVGANPATESTRTTWQASDALRLYARALSGDPATATSASPITAKPTSGRVAGVSGSPPEQAGTQRPPPTLAEVQNNVLAAYAKESIDTSWSRTAERKLQQSITRGLPDGSRLLSMECRSTMCLLQLQHPDSKAAHTLLHQGFKDWGGAVFVAGDVEEDGLDQQTLIAIREDTVPPYAGM